MVGKRDHIAYKKVMAEYKVPQNVEAEDKLIGPFSFRQFVYLLIALAAAALAYFLGRMLIFLAFIPAPIGIVFLVLALPLRKDQPMETYIGALIHFYFTPNRRLWNPDGQESLIEITNPSIDSEPQIKEIGGAEAAQRLSFLSEVADTQGWSTRGVSGMPINNTNLNDDLAIAAFDVPDILDNNDALSQTIDDKLASAKRQQNERVSALLSPSPAAAAVAQPNIAPPSSPVAPNFSLPATPFPRASADGSGDEQTIAAALRQSSQSKPNSFQQTVIQPPGVHNATIPRAPERTEPPTYPNQIPAPAPAQPISPTTPPAEVAAGMTKNPEPAKMESISTNRAEPSPPASPASANVSTDKEIDLGGGDNNSELEVILH